MFCLQQWPPGIDGNRLDVWCSIPIKKIVLECDCLMLSTRKFGEQNIQQPPHPNNRRTECPPGIPPSAFVSNKPFHPRRRLHHERNDTSSYGNR